MSYCICGEGEGQHQTPEGLLFHRGEVIAYLGPTFPRVCAHHERCGCLNFTARRSQWRRAYPEARVSCWISEETRLPICAKRRRARPLPEGVAIEQRWEPRPVDLCAECKRLLAADPTIETPHLPPPRSKIPQ